MMKKRMLALVMTLAMCLSLLPVSALAAGEEGGEGGTSSTSTYVAQITRAEGETTTTTQYESLDKAISAAQDKDTIELLADCTTGGITLNDKTLTIQGTRNETITFRNKGILANNSNLTFKHCKIDMVISDHPGGNGATANLIDDSNLTLISVKMTLTNDHNDAAGESGIYLYQNSNLYIDNGSNVIISEFNDSAGSSGIYADNSEYDENNPNRSIVIDNQSKLSISKCGWHGMTINPIDLTVKNGSSVTLTENGNESYGGGLGCYYGKLTLSNASTFLANNNQGSAWGIFIKDLAIDSTSTLEACNNTGMGLTVGGKGTIATGAKVRLNDNNKTGLYVYPSSDPWGGDVTIENNVDLEILRNKNRGIYNANLLTMKSGTVMNNTATKSGGGICNSGTATLSDAVKLYNNHASVAGDDIYSVGTITFGPVGSDWVLDDCDHAIDGWYVDGANSRWSTHAKPVHVEEYTAGANITATANDPLALKAAHGLIPLDPGNSGTDNWAISKSKTATNLNSSYESQVTLSLPSAEEALVSDVVFVLDKSTSTEVQTQALEMLENLQTKVAETNAKVKVGVVIFNKVANVANDGKFFDLSTEYSGIETAFKQKISSGTNTHAGLLAGKAMLDNDTSVDANRKYLIFVSDGISYMYDSDGKILPYYWMQDNSPYYSDDPYSWQFKYGNNNPPSDWSAWIGQIGDILKTETITPILYTDHKTSKDDKTINPEDYSNVSSQSSDTYTTSVDRGLYNTYQTYAAAQKEGYHCYAIMKETTTAYSWGPAFMSYLADGEEVKFTDIQNDIYYLLAAGSKVEDYIGYKENDYNFDFVNNADKLTLKVGEDTYTTATGTITETDTQETARYIFTHDGVSAANNAEAPFVLHYYANGQDGNSAECFVWDINVPVSNFAPVQLTYTVKLTNPQTSAGTYGKYDADGSEKYDGLYTNNSATLYPMDSNGDKGVPENFPKPTVSYTVSGGGSSSGGGTSKPPVLNTKDHYGYIIGYPVDYATGESTNDQTRMPVKPEGNITRAEVATIFFRMLTDDSRSQFWSQSSEYSDVKTSDWFNNAICTLSNAGILSGYENGTFAPNGKITRAEFATIASRFFEYQDSTGSSPFTDVDEGSWYYRYILAASEMGLINGYPDGTFRPNAPITRAEAVTIVNRTLDRHPDQDHFLPDMLVWPDNMDTTKWYYADMQEATNSHEYEMKGSGDSKYENWTKMLPIRDWAAFEKAWSDANSATGGEVSK